MIRVRKICSAFVLFSCLMTQESLSKAANSPHSISASTVPRITASLVEKARLFVQETGQEILGILQSKETSKQVQEDQFRAILQQRFDLKAIGFFCFRSL